MKHRTYVYMLKKPFITISIIIIAFAHILIVTMASKRKAENELDSPSAKKRNAIEI